MREVNEEILSFASSRKKVREIGVSLGVISAITSFVSSLYPIGIIAGITIPEIYEYVAFRLIKPSYIVLLYDLNKELSKIITCSKIW